jgi:hypothetical protein
VRCAYITNGALLSGFTLTNGGTWFQSPDSRDKDGGGAWCETNAIVSNCIIVSNSAIGGYGGGGIRGSYYSCTIISNTTGLFAGGGASSCFMSNCIVNGNSSWYNGGGAAFSTLINCSLTGNSTKGTDTVGGGAFASTLNNCNLVGNSTITYGGAVSDCTLTNCTISNNSAHIGGGATYNSQLSGCSVISNSAPTGGGAYGGTLFNCILSGNQASSSHGGGAYSSTLYDCAVKNNSAASTGGGASGGSLMGCTIAGNRAPNGGGIAGGSAISCLIVSNVAFNGGGGAFSAVLTNCTLVGNSASTGGGTGAGGYPSLVYNCISYFNTAPTGVDFDASDTLFFSCAAQPSSGSGNITNAPLFVDQVGENFRLQLGSPGIDSGTNILAANSFDRDGRPRIVNGTVDMGAYEFQGAGMGEFIAWLQQYVLPTDGSVDYADSDGDSMNNWQEWIAGTNPTNALSVLEILDPAPGAPGIVVTWQSVNTRTYYLQRGTNLTVQPAFSSIQSNIVGQAGTTSYTDTAAVGAGPFFYRVGVQQ